MTTVYQPPPTKVITPTLSAANRRLSYGDGIHAAADVTGVGPPRASTRTWCGLLILLLPALLTSMDISLLFVAGPEFGAALRPTATQWTWAMDIYSFVTASLLITMGDLGDRIGRRRVLLMGAALFGVGSILLAYAPNAELFILDRAVLGVGGATLAPSTLSLIRGMFADEHQRRSAIGIWSVAFSGGAVAGPIIGGALLGHFWWGSVFLINVPIMVLLLAAGPFLIVESRSSESTRFDLLGAATSLVAILCLVYALQHTASNGPTLAAAGTAVLGGVAFALFLSRLRRTQYPLIDLTLLRTGTFTGAVGVNTVSVMVVSGLGSLAFPYLQIGHGLTALQSALWGLPPLLGVAAGATAAAKLARRLPAGYLLSGGMLAVATGFAVIATIGPETDLEWFVGGYVILAFGSAVAGTTANSLMLTSAPPNRAGSAAGIAETSAQLGAASGIAVLSTLTTTMYRHTMSRTAPTADAPVRNAVTGALTASRGVRRAAVSAYTHGLTISAVGCVVVTAAIAACLVAVEIHRRRGYIRR